MISAKNFQEILNKKSKASTTGVLENCTLSIQQFDNRVVFTYTNENTYTTQTFWTIDNLSKTDEDRIKKQDKTITAILSVATLYVNKETLFALSAPNLNSFVEKVTALINANKTTKRVNALVIFDKTGVYTETPARKGAVELYKEDVAPKLEPTSWEKENRMKPSEGGGVNYNNSPTPKPSNDDLPF